MGPRRFTGDDLRSRRRWIWVGGVVVIGALGLNCTSQESGSSSPDQDSTKVLNAALQAHVKGDISGAEAGYWKVLDLDERSKFAMYNLGLIEQNRNRPDEAERRYREALKIDAEYPPALFNLAILRSGRGDVAEAISLYRKNIAVNDKDAAAHLNLGLLLKQTGDGAGGDAEVKRALELDPKLAQ